MADAVRRLILPACSPTHFLAGLVGTVNAAPIWGRPARSLLLVNFVYGPSTVIDATGRPVHCRDVRLSVRDDPSCSGPSPAADWSALTAATAGVV